MKTIIQADELPQDIAGTEELLARHSEHKMELDARKHNFHSFQNKGKKLIAASHYARLEVTSYCMHADNLMIGFYIHFCLCHAISDSREDDVFGQGTQRVTRVVGSQKH